MCNFEPFRHIGCLIDGCMHIYNCKTQRLICFASCIIRAGSLKDSHAQPVMCLIIVVVRQVSRPNCEDIQGVKDMLKWPQNEQSE